MGWTSTLATRMAPQLPGQMQNPAQNPAPSGGGVTLTPAAPRTGGGLPPGFQSYNGDIYNPQHASPTPVPGWQQAPNGWYYPPGALTPTMFAQGQNAGTPRTTGGVTPTQGQPAAKPPNQISPAYVGNVPSSNPALVSGVPNITPNQFTQQILSAMAPIFGQQRQGLTEALANAGIVGGSTAGAVGNLTNEQNQQAIGQISPLVASILQGDQSVAQQTGEFNATQENAAQQFDIGNILRTAMFNSGNFNDFLSMITQGKNQDWLAQLGANASLAGGQQAAFQPNYIQPSGTNFSGLGAALAPTPTITNSAPGGWNLFGGANPFG